MTTRQRIRWVLTWTNYTAGELVRRVFPWLPPATVRWTLHKLSRSGQAVRIGRRRDQQTQRLASAWRAV